MNKNQIKMKSFTLAYFSGTGCTKTVVDCFESQLIELGIHVNKINIATCNNYDIESSDFLIIFSPVYAFRLASIVENWVKNLPKTDKVSAAILSVSGGGEVSPNTACRVFCKRLLKRKGYHMVYEKMLVMPSNFATQGDQQLNSNLITIMPRKTKKIINDMISGKENITNPKLQDRFFSSIGKMEHYGAKFFGATIHASDACNQCGLCVRNCPNKNIQMKNGMPKFGFRCLWCMKCIYACPQKALAPRILKFVVLENGFNIKKMSEMAKQNENHIEYNSSKDIMMQGAIDYINEECVK
jgi:ferredoxin